MRPIGVIALGILLLVACQAQSLTAVPRTPSPTASASITAPSNAASPPPTSTATIAPRQATLTASSTPTAQGQNGDSDSPSISADGRWIAFASRDSGLVPGDTQECGTDPIKYNCQDIFVYDHQTHQIERASVTSDGAQAKGDSSSPSISGDGRYVAFMSWANNLVPGDTNNAPDIFVYDRQTRNTERVSVASDGRQANDRSDYASISADGRYVAFMSRANNLVPGDTNNAHDIFVHDRHTGKTGRVSIGSDGSQGNGESTAASISVDGQWVAFASAATNLITGITGGVCNVYVHDRQTGSTELTSIDKNGQPVGGDAPAISAGGQRVAFLGAAIFVRDRQLGQLRQLTQVVPGGVHSPICGSGGVSISADGHWVAFSLEQTPNPKQDIQDIFVYGLQTNRIEQITHGNSLSNFPSISADGHWIAFRSNASNLMASDAKECKNDSQVYQCGNIFLYDHQTGQFALVSVSHK